MSDNADYEIVARIVARDASDAGAKSAEDRLKQVEQRATATGNSISGMFRGMFAALAGGAGIGTAVRGIVGLNSSIDDAKNGLATLYSALTGADIGSSFRAASKDIQGLQEDARRGIGELSDYTESFQRILAPGLSAGASREQLRELTRNAIAATGASGRGLWQAGADVQQALTAGAAQRTTPIVSMALAAIGTTEEAFNRLKPAERITELTRAFQSFGPGVALMGQSWSAQASTFSDTLKSIARTVSRPLFDAWLERLRQANAWLDAHRMQIEDIATRWGAKLVRTWDTLIERAGTYAAIVAAAQLAPSLTSGASSAAGLAGRAAGWASGTLIPALRDPLGMMKMMGVAGATGGLGEVLAPLATAATRLVAPLAIIGTAFLAIRGALGEFPSVTGYALAAWGRLSGAFSALGGAFDSLTAKGSALNLVGAGLVGALGLAADAAGVVVRSLASLALGLGLVFGVVGDGFRAIYLLSTGRLAEASKISVMGRLSETSKALGEVWSPTYKSPYKTGWDHTQDGGLPPVAQNVTHINGPVTFNVKTEINNDPARVVRAWEEGVDLVRRARVQGKRNAALAGV